MDCCRVESKISSQLNQELLELLGQAYRKKRYFVPRHLSIGSICPSSWSWSSLSQVKSSLAHHMVQNCHQSDQGP